MWLIAQYEATSLFSLKSSLATSSAGKTLLIPTPFALKMALLDVAIRTRGLSQGQQDFEWIRDLEIAIDPAPVAVVTNLFAKIQKPRRTDKSKEEKEAEKARKEAGIEEADEEGEASGPFGPTIAYREYVHLRGQIGIAFAVKPGLWEAEGQTTLGNLLLQINYLGKRGGFFQLVDGPNEAEDLPPGYISMTGESKTIPYPGLLQVLDDCGPDLTFDKADIYSDKKIRLGRERVLRSVVVPYKLERSSRSYSFYRRTPV